ncbi:transmembrane protein 211-like [Lingula anatina]|uniref:Transmembrane protein 211-like n=1 Tax=Lingula anatina TaxID=7574 RepID=A0A1S3JJC5_LINAN|nr:transmembrane protein 211-like [Lingula anatina]|eukprot:XP_013410515.1 transmembrane protein 211-like [Lingula anatina]
MSIFKSKDLDSDSMEETGYHCCSTSCRDRARVMATPISLLWTLLSMLVAASCAFSFMQPYWIIDFEQWNSFGIYSFCYQENHSPDRTVHHHHCRIYGGHFDFSFFPSSAWQASCVLFGGGCAFLCFAAILAITSLCLPSACDKKVALSAGYMQLVAVLIMIAGLIVYPFGLDSRLVSYYCGKTGIFNSGDCHFGWAYMLGIVGTALAMFCPFLAQYTDTKAYGPVCGMESYKPYMPEYSESNVFRPVETEMKVLHYHREEAFL